MNEEPEGKTPASHGICNSCVEVTLVRVMAIREGPLAYRRTRQAAIAGGGTCP
jgi:hypothetical protein